MRDTRKPILPNEAGRDVYWIKFNNVCRPLKLFTSDQMRTAGPSDIEDAVAFNKASFSSIMR